ncbi:PP2D1 [Bugula neritina]|uniref:PP2D1 n=1 Tax=Bugula neritina TaxID=10212 RepID=A0A7J7IT58_BUGNE|nr:PP2D1 [Bugula neritina]
MQKFTLHRNTLGICASCIVILSVTIGELIHSIMETAVVTSKPPLPQPVSTHRAEEATDGSAFSLSIYQQHLRTSQMETMSDGTILGLRDIIYQNEPDLTYYCSLCNRFVSLLLLKDHKTYHNALSLLEFHYPPSSLKSLLNRRTAILKRLKDNASLEETTLTLKTIQLINDSYEIVKQEIEDTFECCRKIEENINTKVEGSHLGCCLDFVSAVGCCSDQNSRWKQAMEDCKVYQDYYGNDKGRAFVALYDGYNGSYAASVAANELHYLLLMEMAKFDKTIKCKCTFNMLERNDVTKYDLIESPAKPCQHKRQLHRQSANFLHQVIYTCEELDYEGTNHLSSHHPIRKDLSTNKQSERKDEKTTHRQHMKAALRRAYQLTDEVLSFGGDERSKVRWSGCSAVTVVMENVDNSESCPASPSSDKVGGKSYEEPRPIGRLYLANTGNCHAVLVRDNRAYQLTKSHTYENLRERSRVLSAGGTFSQSEREMRVNGVLLTTRGLGNHGDPTIKQLMSCEPHCAAVEVDQYAQLLIVATPGIWQVFSPQEAAELLLQVRLSNQLAASNIVYPIS